MKAMILPTVRLYAVTFAAFLLLDGLWLGVVARGFYRQHLGHLLAPRMSLLPAALFYTIYVAAVLALAVAPALKAGSPGAALWRGALLGLAAYGAYDLTNQATIRDWPVIVTIVDMLWGTSVTVAASLVGVLVERWMG